MRTLGVRGSFGGAMPVAIQGEELVSASRNRAQPNQLGFDLVSFIEPGAPQKSKPRSTSIHEPNVMERSFKVSEELSPFRRSWSRPDVEPCTKPGSLVHLAGSPLLVREFF